MSQPIIVHTNPKPAYGMWHNNHAGEGYDDRERTRESSKTKLDNPTTRANAATIYHVDTM